MAIEERVVKGDGPVLPGAEGGPLGMALWDEGEAVGKEGLPPEEWVRREWGPW